MKRVAFLFGSGISLHSGAPTVCNITEALFNCGWREDGDKRFYENGTESTGIAKRAQDFLYILKNYIDPHLQSRENRSSHYEDLHSAAVQILQDELHEIVNPMIRGSLSEIRNLTPESLYQGLECPQLENGDLPNEFSCLAYKASLLIHSVVLNKLWPIETPKRLEILTSCASQTGQMDIFSLNHDLLIERQLGEFADGFSERRGDVFRFDRSWWKKETRKRLYKLHGSLDWYRFKFSDGVRQFAKVPRNIPPDKCKDSDRTDLDLPNKFPLFLAGTVGKDRLYSVGFLRELFCQFYESLREHQTLICCGYGWRDKGINNYVTQWLGESCKNRIVLLHDPSNGELDKLKQTQYWSKYWAWCEGWCKVVHIPKWLCDCEMKDLEQFFDN